MCHVALSSQAITPHEGQTVELCVPGDLVTRPVRDICYIPRYYGISFPGIDESEEQAATEPETIQDWQDEAAE